MGNIGVTQIWALFSGNSSTMCIKTFAQITNTIYKVVRVLERNIRKAVKFQRE